MKIKIPGLFLSILLSAGLIAQDRTDYIIKNPVGISSVNEAADIARQIVHAAGLKANFVIAEADVPNALAVLHQGKRYVLYNRGFVNRLTRATGTKWAAISVLAHEIGHHLYHSLSGRPVRGLATELEADQFSGYVLENMGATLEEAQAAMNVLATPYATRTHPAQDDRIHSIATGYELAGGNIPEKNTDERNTPDLSAVIAKIQFTNAANEKYYITTGLTIIKIEDDQEIVIGQVRRSNYRDYPFILSDADGYEFYVSGEGEIVNGRGKVVGKLTKAG